MFNPEISPEERKRVSAAHSKTVLGDQYTATREDLDVSRKILSLLNGQPVIRAKTILHEAQYVIELMAENTAITGMPDDEIWDLHVQYRTL